MAEVHCNCIDNQVFWFRLPAYIYIYTYMYVYFHQRRLTNHLFISSVGKNRSRPIAIATVIAFKTLIFSECLKDLPFVFVILASSTGGCFPGN